MKTIWKYELSPDVYLTIPINGEILTVQTQNDVAMMWVLVNPEHDTERRHFKVFGTGHTITDKKIKYINTFQFDNGVLIFHVFEIYD